MGPTGNVIFSPFQSSAASGGALDRDDGFTSFFNSVSGVETITLRAGYPRGTYTAIVSNSGIFYPNKNNVCHNGVDFSLQTFACNKLQSTVSTLTSQASFNDLKLSFVAL
jgi:hypothetical protein